MGMNDDGLTPREHSEMRDILLAGTQRIRPAGARGNRSRGGRAGARADRRRVRCRDRHRRDLRNPDHGDHADSVSVGDGDPHSGGDSGSDSHLFGTS